MLTLALLLTTAVLALQVYDAYTTYNILVSGRGREGNKALEWLRQRIVALPFGGPWLWLAVAKGVVPLALGYGWYRDVWANPYGLASLMLLTAWYVFICERNYRIMKG